MRSYAGTSGTAARSELQAAEVAPTIRGATVRDGARRGPRPTQPHNRTRRSAAPTSSGHDLGRRAGATLQDRARDVSAALLLPFITLSTQQAASEPGITSSDFVGKGPAAVRNSVERQEIVMVTTVAASSMSGGMTKAAPAPEGDRPTERTVDVGDRWPPVLASRGVAPSNVAPTALIANPTGLHGGPGATRRRFQPPQPPPRGGIAGVVHLPASTTRAPASPPPPAR